MPAYVHSKITYRDAYTLYTKQSQSSDVCIQWSYTDVHIGSTHFGRRQRREHWRGPEGHNGGWISLTYFVKMYNVF